MLVVLPNAFGDAATNMAIDSALLETVPDETAAFRHYGWLEPSLTFGYSQRIEEVRRTAPADLALCRRPSGGGMVDHRDDWTYALIIHRKAPITNEASTTLYATIHQSIARALEGLGQASTLAPCPRKCDASPQASNAPDQCFIRPVMNDVLNPEGRKIAGAAMKRSKRALLVQGSVDRGALNADFDFGAFAGALADELAKALRLPLEQPEDLRPYFDSRLIEEEKRKFADPTWTERR